LQNISPSVGYGVMYITCPACARTQTAVSAISCLACRSVHLEIGGGLHVDWRLQLLVVLGFGGVEVGAACFKPAAAVHAKRSWGPGQQTDKAASQWTAGGGVHHTDCHSAHPLAPSSMGRPHCLVLLHASMLSPQHSAVLAAPHRTSHTCLLLASPGDRCDEGDEVMRQCSKADAVQQR
jgi:hypothetical protein